MSNLSTDRMTIDELIEEYNRLGPVEPLEQWDGSRDELVGMVRIARKQPNANGITRSVTYSAPNTSRRSD